MIGGGARGGGRPGDGGRCFGLGGGVGAGGLGMDSRGEAVGGMDVDSGSMMPAAPCEGNSPPRSSGDRP